MFAEMVPLYTVVINCKATGWLGKHQAKQLYDKSNGYAVFYDTQTALMLAGGGELLSWLLPKTGKRACGLA